MKLRYTGKEPYRFNAYPNITLKKGDEVDWPQARCQKYLAHPALSKLFEPVKEKTAEKPSKKKEKQS